MKRTMRVNDLIVYLKQFKPSAFVFLGSDEELNTIYGRIEVGLLGDESKVVLWGTNSSIIDDDDPILA